MTAGDNPEVSQCGGAIGQYVTAYIKKQSCYADGTDCGFVGYHEDTVITLCELEVYGVAGGGDCVRGSLGGKKDALSVNCGDACTGTLKVSADNAYRSAYINGVNVGSGSSWQSVEEYAIAVSASDGQLVIAIDATDAEVSNAGIGGLLAEVTIAGKVFGSDDSWKCWSNGEAAADSHDATPPDGWTVASYDDSDWPVAAMHSGFADSRWGFGAATACNGCDNIWNHVFGHSNPGISENANWIWTADQEVHNDVFCRVTIDLTGAGSPAVDREFYFGDAVPDSGTEVRKTPRWPRSWANFSLFQLYFRRNTWANLYILGQPNTFPAGGRIVGRRHGLHRTRRAGWPGIWLDLRQRPGNRRLSDRLVRWNPRPGPR
jgi:hypothetical protein